MKTKIRNLLSGSRKGQGGFTMIELILVITVLGILAVMALPNFYDVSSAAKTSARDGIIGAVKGGINMFRSNALINGTTPTVPADLDALASYPTSCSATTECFANVLQDPVTDERWVKSAAFTYTWAPTVGGTVAITCSYDAATGLFSCS